MLRKTKCPVTHYAPALPLASNNPVSLPLPIFTPRRSFNFSGFKVGPRLKYAWKKKSQAFDRGTSSHLQQTRTLPLGRSLVLQKSVHRFLDTTHRYRGHPTYKKTNLFQIGIGEQRESCNRHTPYFGGLEKQCRIIFGLAYPPVNICSG